MTDSLFRHEVLQAKRSSWLGGVSLAQPLSLWVLAGFAVLAAALIVGLLVFGEYTRRSKVTGQLIPDLGLSTVVAPTAGVVARLFPEEGDSIGAGDSLTLINVPRAMASGGDALALLREGMDTRRASMDLLGQSQATLIDAQIAGFGKQLAAARRELAQIEDEIVTRGEQVRIGRENIERYRKVVAEKYVSQLQLDQQQQSTLELVNAQQSLERQATSIRGSIVRIQQTLQELPVQKRALLASSSRDMAILDQERVQQEANGELLLKAPVAGLVASRMIELGQGVQAGQPLMAILPKGSKLQAQLMVPSSAVGFVGPGDRVLLRYQAFPYQKFGHHAGKVLRVSRSATNPASGQAGEPHYRVLVQLDRQSVTAYGRSEPLRPGMVLDADILGERRKLYEWVLEPLYSLHGKIGEG